MFRVYPVPGGFQIFWCPSWPKTDTDKIPRSAKVYPFKQAAYRRAKELNEKQQAPASLPEWVSA